MKPVHILAIAALTGVAGFWLGGSLGLAVAWESLGIALEVALLGSWPLRRARAGVETLQFKKEPRHKALMLVAGLSGLIAAAAGLTIGGNGISDLLLNTVVLLLVPLFILEAVVPNRFTREGVLQFERFLSWSSVGAYSWRGPHLHLWPNAEEQLPWWKLGDQHRLMAVTVPEENREQVVELLLQHLPGRRADDSLRQLMGANGNARPRVALDFQAQIRARLREGDEGKAIRLILDSTNASDPEAKDLIERLKGDESVQRISRPEGEKSC